MLALNRSALVVRPRSPFLDWLHAVDPTSASLTLGHLTREPTIYLVSECGGPDDNQVYLQAVFSTAGGGGPDANQVYLQASSSPAVGGTGRGGDAPVPGRLHALV